MSYHGLQNCNLRMSHNERTNPFLQKHRVRNWKARIALGAIFLVAALFIATPLLTSLGPGWSFWIGMGIYMGVFTVVDWIGGKFDEVEHE